MAVVLRRPIDNASDRCDNGSERLEGASELGKDVLKTSAGLDGGRLEGGRLEGGSDGDTRVEDASSARREGFRSSEPSTTESDAAAV